MLNKCNVIRKKATVNGHFVLVFCYTLWRQLLFSILMYYESNDTVNILNCAKEKKIKSRVRGDDTYLRTDVRDQ